MLPTHIYHIYTYIVYTAIPEGGNGRGWEMGELRFFTGRPATMGMVRFLQTYLPHLGEPDPSRCQDGGSGTENREFLSMSLLCMIYDINVAYIPYLLVSARAKTPQ